MEPQSITTKYFQITFFTLCERASFEHPELKSLENTHNEYNAADKM